VNSERTKSVLLDESGQSRSGGSALRATSGGKKLLQ
jgi:hypothetical protein